MWSWNNLAGLPFSLFEDLMIPYMGMCVSSRPPGRCQLCIRGLRRLSFLTTKAIFLHRPHFNKTESSLAKTKMNPIYLKRHIKCTVKDDICEPHAEN